MNRRTFLRQALGSVPAVSAAAAILADPYALSARPRRLPSPVRVRGRVQAAGRGLTGVGVTDGLTFATTDGDGGFELLSNARQPYVYLSLPAGYEIPKNTPGTARFYEPLHADAAGEMRVLFDLAARQPSDEHHAFFVLADPQTQNEDELGWLHAQTVPDVQAAVKALGDVPSFGVSCGDIMFDDLSLYPDYERAVERMGIPFFQVVGNHDLDQGGRTDEASTLTFERYFGPRYYSFDVGMVHYAVLDDVFWNGVGYTGYLDGDQLAWLEQDLARIEPGRPVVVFLHIPALSTQYAREGSATPSPTVSITNRELLYRFLEPYEAHLISGHTHENEHVFEGGAHEHVLGATCGAWWSGPICFDGTPNGYAIFEARGADLRWRHKATGLDADHQLRVYARGTDPKAPDEIVANVWGWDPTWAVVWYEDGERKGEMARRVGTDPLSERLHRGEALPERRPWVEPVPTAHLFYAPAGAGAGGVRVEVTDRWGNVFSALPEAS